MELVYIYIGMSIFAIIGIIALSIDSHKSGSQEQSTPTT